MKINLFLKRLFLPSCLVFCFVSYSGAYLSDSVSTTGNTFVSGTWEEEAPQIIINEMMWSGSVGKANDEWLELRNLSDHDVDLSGWQITNSNPGHETYMLTIPSGTIPANGYFLVSNLSESVSSIKAVPNYVDTSLTLSNSKLLIKLYKGDWNQAGNLIDAAGDGNVPLAGIHKTSTPKEDHSMSRVSGAQDGTIAASWYSDMTDNSTTYWDVSDGNYGTPGGPNV